MGTMQTPHRKALVNLGICVRLPLDSPAVQMCNHTLLSGILMDESMFGLRQEKVGIVVLGLFYKVWAIRFLWRAMLMLQHPLTTWNTCRLPALRVGTFVFQHDRNSVHKGTQTHLMSLAWRKDSGLHRALNSTLLNTYLGHLFQSRSHRPTSALFRLKGKGKGKKGKGKIIFRLKGKNSWGGGGDGRFGW